ncbi:MAG: AAA family ATPase [Bacteroidetes bacterium]|nr:AAA family ATPase [Bacteroidota bacterium]
MRFFLEWLEMLDKYQAYESKSLEKLFSFAIDLPILEPQKDSYTKKEKILPYSLKNVVVANFQGIKNAKIENLPVDTQWVFLVGENGFGKSTVLQAILLGLKGSKDGNYELIQDRSINIQVEYKNNTENVITDCWNNLHPLSHLAAYGPSRLNLQADATISEEARRSSVSYGLFNSDGALLNIEAKMKDWLLQKDEQRFELVRQAFCKLIPYLADVRLNEKTSQIEYLEKDMVNGTESYEPLPYPKLASGFRAIIGLAGDMIVRLSHSQPEVTDPAQLKGIVIIDELDLHWHPKLQKQIPQLFSNVFPKIQFIVSTHSPIPLLGAPHNSVILKVTRNKEEGVKIERVEVDLKYLTPNLILTSGIFDMEDVLSVENDDITQTRTEDTFEEMQHNDEVEKYLEEFEKSNRQFPDELFEPKVS